MNNNNYLDISLVGSDEQNHTLKEFLPKKIVLYFYPKDNTPGCTIENKDFSCLIDEFNALETIVIGVSRDSIKSHQNFKNKHELSQLLLSDPNEELCKAFDVIKEKMMYGKKVIGIERSTFVLDGNGNILKEYRKVSTKDHAQMVLNEIKAFS